MKKKTKIIIIAVVAVALVALAVWYFVFHKKKAKETDEASGKTVLSSFPTGLNVGPTLSPSDLFRVPETSVRVPETSVRVPETSVDVIHRTDYEVAPAAAYRLNSDQLSQLEAHTGNIKIGSLVNTNKKRR